MPRRSMKSPEQLKKETRERAEAKEKAKDNMFLTGGQAKIAAKAPPPNKIDEKDFAVLRAEKAKGRGMGLQDEKVKPGKVMKAKRGKAIEKLAKKKGLPVPLASSIPGGTKKGFFKAFGQFPAVPSKGKSALTAKGTSKTFAGYSKPFEGPQFKGKVSTIVGVKPGAKIIGQRKKFKSMEEMRKAKGFKMIGGKQETSAQFNRRKAREGRALRAAKATGIRGKIALGVGLAGAGAIQYLKSKMKKEDKKMGGGMMKKYSVGGGADTGTVGEQKSRLGVLSNKVKRLSRRLKDKDRLTQRDIEGLKDKIQIKKRVRAMQGFSSRDPMPMSKKMGGGMMKKYNRGGMYLEDEKIKKVFPKKDAKQRANISQLVGGDRVSPMKKERFTAGQSARRRDILKKIGKGAIKTTPLGLGLKVAETAKKLKEKITSRVSGGPASEARQRKKNLEERVQKAGVSNIFSNFRQGAKKAEKKYASIPSGMKKDRDTDTKIKLNLLKSSRKDPFKEMDDTRREVFATERMGGGMMNKPMGYKSGTSVKVKCKLGRNKPTKMY